jgi:exo-poly-alpha-galacturonosidase
MKGLQHSALTGRWRWLLMGLLSQSVGAQAVSPAAKHFVLNAYGAKGDGQTVNTAAVQAAIDAASVVPGGGTVVVPAGVFRTGAVFLKPGVSLLVEKDGVLKGTANTADYPR